MLHFQPTNKSSFRNENPYEDWLQTLTQHQFHEHLAGRLPGPTIGSRRSVIHRAHGILAIIASAAVLYLIFH